MENRLSKQGSSDLGLSGGLTKLLKTRATANGKIDLIPYCNFWQGVLIYN